MQRDECPRDVSAFYTAFMGRYNCAFTGRKKQRDENSCKGQNLSFSELRVYFMLYACRQCDRKEIICDDFSEATPRRCSLVVSITTHVRLFPSINESQNLVKCVSNVSETCKYKKIFLCN